MRVLTSRDLVVELLRTLSEAENAWHTGSGGEGVIRTPTIYREGSYAELERCLIQMRDGHLRREWWHLSSRYLWGMEHNEVVRYKRTTKGPLAELPPRSELLISIEVLPKTLMLVRLYTWSPEVDPRMVDQGLDELLGLMYGGDTEKIQLPQELLYLALGKEPPNDHRPRASKVPSAPLPATASSW